MFTKKYAIATLKYYRDRSKISFNSGISIEIEAFEVVRRAVEIFKTIDREFQNETDIENIIRKSLNRIEAQIFSWLSNRFHKINSMAYGR